MKTLHTTHQIAVVTCLFMLTMTATGQPNTRQDRRNGSERREMRTGTNQRSQGHSKAWPVENTEDHQRGSHYTRNEGRKKGHHQPSSAHVHHSPRKQVYQNPAPVYHAPNPHVYYRHLPTQRVNRFHYNGYDYFHSNNHFYRHHPHHGYRMVEAPFTHVSYLPARYQVRVYNGYSYPYHNGYFFLPAEYGYVMVPAPARPQTSFNIVLNF